MIPVLAMFRAAVALLFAAIMVQAITTDPVLEHSLSPSACAADDPDGGPSSAGDEALAARHTVLAQPAAPRQSLWHGPEPSVVASPAPDEILHVPKLLLA